MWSYTFFWNIFSFDLNLTIERPIQFKLLIHKQKNMSLCHLGEQWIKVVIWICLHWINVESKTDYWDNETVYQAFFFNGQISGKLFLVVRVMCFIFFLNIRLYTLINTLRKQLRNVNVLISSKILSCLPELWIVCSRYQLLDTWASRLGNHAIVKLYYNPEERHQLIQNNKIRLKNTTFSSRHHFTSFGIC